MFVIVQTNYPCDFFHFSAILYFSSQMRIVLQKVLSASVSVEGQTISKIGKGIMCLVGLRDNDDPACAEVLAKKILVCCILFYKL